jgi:endonuclease/exonuclease/phosphatase family metal-dependent hydrolase
MSTTSINDNQNTTHIDEDKKHTGNDIDSMGNVSHSEVCMEEELAGKEEDEQHTTRPPRVCIQPLLVMSFNVRVDTIFDGKNAWKYRSDLVTETIKQEQVDVVGIQEALPHQVSDLEKLLDSENYSCVRGAGQYLDESTQEFVGEHCPIFYNKQRLELVESGHFWYSDDPSRPGSKGWDSVSPRLCNWCKFQTLAGTEKIVFYLFNTQWDHAISARRNSGYILREYIENYTVNFDENNRIDQAHTIVLGDLNSTTQSNSYTVLTKGIDLGGAEDSDEESEGSDSSDDIFKLFNVIDVYNQTGKQSLALPETYTGFRDGCDRTGPRKGQPATVDYILVSSDIKVENVKIVDRVFDDERRASTHRPVVADLMV